MRPTWTSTLWLEFLGGLLITLGTILAGLAWLVATHPPDPGVSKAMANLWVDLPGLNLGIAQRLSGVGAVLGGFGAVLFFGAVYLVRAFRWVLGLAAVLTVGIWVWLALR
ncbi:MAG: hypothetical protein C4331_07500 [Meiothermus sp.]